jgi:signal transduction histidine kinase
LQGDLQRLQDILINVVGNAIKFTEQGTIDLQIYQQDPQHWALQVSDTGPGIPKEAQTYIFESFRQVDGSITRRHEGVGLGLSIVKQLVSLMGGDIILKSELGKGSTFTIILPLEPIQENVV